MNNQIKLIELFAGSRSIGTQAEAIGMQVFSSDIEPFENINYVTNILDFDPKMVPFIPDAIWASPPCTSFSVASIGHHWNKDNTPKTPDALLGVEIVKKTLSLIKIFLHQNRKRVFYFENPTCKLRKLPIVRGEFDRSTIDYCRYGANCMNPTDIGTNNLYSMYNLHGWKPRPRCFPGNTKCHHEPAPRGSKTGTQGRNGAYDRSKIPPLLCQEILKSIPKPQIILP